MGTEGGSITVEESGAFVESFLLEPTKPGTLDGLSFAVKDLVDVAGRVAGCGNPTWRDTHPPAAAHAVCVELLLAAGAACVGATVTDELAFSLLGENHFYGTPLNPRAMGRIPGGSSSGSASAVACGLADFAIGTDTGGSVRVPASNCGIFGLRPSHGVASVAGVMPFAPGFDTVGLFARTPEVLSRAAAVLLGFDPEPRGAREVDVDSVVLLADAFAVADAEVRDALAGPVRSLRDRYGSRVCEASLADLFGGEFGSRLEEWRVIYSALQWAEVRSSVGGWIEASSPEFGPLTAASFALTRDQDRTTVGDIVRRRERLARVLGGLVAPGTLLAIPTAAAAAPLKGSIRSRTADPYGYYPRTLGLTALAGIARLPQVSMPGAEAEGVPVGLSLLAARGEDAALLDAVTQLARP